MSPTLQTFPSLPPVAGDFGQMPLPSASQSHLHSLRHTPSASNSPIENICTQPVLTSPLLNQRIHVNPQTPQHIYSHSPPAFYQPQPVPAFIPPRYIPLQPAQDFLMHHHINLMLFAHWQTLITLFLKFLTLYLLFHPLKISPFLLVNTTGGHGIWRFVP